MTNPFGSFGVPFGDPVLIFAFALLLFLLVPLVFERLRIPGIIGLLLAGALFGPNALGVLERDVTFVLLGQAGLLYIMFVAGLEIDLEALLRDRHRSLVFGLATFLVPQLLGTVMAVYLLGFDLVVAILLASMFASHTLLSYPVASRLGITRTRVVTTAVGGTIITDTLALLVLAIVAAGVRGQLDALFWLTLVPSVLLYGVAVFVGLPRLGRLFFRRVRGGGVAEFLFVLAAMYIVAFAAGLVRLEPIIGAFLAGLSLNRLVPRGSALMNRIGFVGHAIFIPFFLVSTGMLVDVRVLAEPSAWIVAGAMVVGVTVTKFLAALAAGRILRFSRAEALVLFGMSVPQAAATLAATFVGIEIGLFGDAVLNGAILMILVTCLIGPFSTQTFGRVVARAELAARPDAEEAPQRILVPLANPETARALVELAVVVRRGGSTEPLLPITVVDAGGDAVGGVAAAERMLAHAVALAAEADTPAVPLTRVDRNPAFGIARAALEVRASDVVIGWNGSPGARTALFGSVIDQVLESVGRRVWVCRLERPLGTYRGVVAAVPPSGRGDPAVDAAVRELERFARRLGRPLELVTVAASPPGARVGDGDVHAVASREALAAELTAAASRGALVSAVGGRGAGGVIASWGSVPAPFRDATFDFVVLFPATAAGGDGRPLTSLLAPEGIQDLSG